VHELVVAQPRERAAQPDEDEDEEQHLREEPEHGPVPGVGVSHSDSGHGARQPPRNMVVASAATVAMLMYSARKNSANFSDEYSVWKPPTSSPSASGGRTARGWSRRPSRSCRSRSSAAATARTRASPGRRRSRWSTSSRRT
jgi:hypothetical protein